MTPIYTSYPFYDFTIVQKKRLVNQMTHKPFVVNRKLLLTIQRVGIRHIKVRDVIVQPAFNHLTHFFGNFGLARMELGLQAPRKHRLTFHALPYEQQDLHSF